MFVAIVAVVVQGPMVNVQSRSGTATTEQATTIHGPIRIMSDADFLMPSVFSGVIGGAGSPSDPFLIRGWDISSGVGSGIHIANTRAHVTIEANRIGEGNIAPAVCINSGFETCAPTLCSGNECATGFPRDVAIRLENVSNVKVSNNNVSGASLAIALDASEAIIIKHNLLQASHFDDVSGQVLTAAKQLESELEGAQRELFGFAAIRTRHHPFIGIAARDTKGLEIRSNVIMSDEAIRGVGVEIADSSAMLIGNSLAGHSTALATTKSVLESSTNTFLGAYVVAIGPGSTLRSDGDTFENIGFLSVCGAGTYALLQRASLLNSTLISSTANPACPAEDLRVEVWNSLFEKGGASVQAAGSIRDSIFLHGSLLVTPQGDRAALVVDTTLDIHGNSFVGGDIGVLVRNASPNISGNILTTNRIGVAAIGTVKPLLSGNCLVDNSEHSLWNSDAGTFQRDGAEGTIPVDAANNWWGSPSGPSWNGPNSIFGAATVVPWLMVSDCT